MLIRRLKQAVAVCCLFAAAACATVPDTDALIEMHTRAIALAVPLHRHYNADVGRKYKPDMLDLQSSRGNAVQTGNGAAPEGRD